MHDRDCLHRFMFERYPDTRTFGASGCRVARADRASRLSAGDSRHPGRGGGRLVAVGGDDQIRRRAVACNCRATARCICCWRNAPAVSGCAAWRATGTRAACRCGRIRRSLGIGDLIGAGNLTVTLETDDGAQRYQGIVPIAGERLAESLQVYFENSEQLPTRLWLHADAHGASGMLLQKLPGRERRLARRRRCGGDRRCLAAGAADRRDARRRRNCARWPMRKSCIGCSTKTICGCSSRRRCIFDAAARANGSAACCRAWARRKRRSVLAERGEGRGALRFLQSRLCVRCGGHRSVVQRGRRERPRRLGALSSEPRELSDPLSLNQFLFIGK